MSTLEQQNRHAQLQAQMTVSLNAMRAKIEGQMIEALQRMENRPRISGAQSLPTLSNDRRLNNDNSSATLLTGMVSIPGLSEMANTAVDLATETYGSRKATLARPQDKKPLSIKEMASINDKNNQDILLFAKLGEKLDLLDVYISCGHTKGAIVNGELIPLENADEPKLKPSEKYIANNQNYKIAAPAPKFAA